MRNNLFQDYTTIMQRLYAMVPEVPVSSQQGRTSRALLNLGDFLAPIIGVASTSQVDNLQNHVVLITKNQRKLAKTFAAEAQHLTSFESVVDDCLNTAMDLISTTHSQLTTLSNIQQDVLRSVHVDLAVTSLLLKQLQAGQQFLSQLHALESAMLQLLSGKLPASVITRTMLLSVLNKIESSLKTQDRSFRLTHKHTNFYYEHATYAFVRQNNTIILNIAIPISSTPSFQAYRLTTYPVVIPNMKHTTILTGNPDIFLLSTDPKLHGGMSLPQFLLCKF